jgi:hypothetical protein
MKPLIRVSSEHVDAAEEQGVVVSLVLQDLVGAVAVAAGN